jgi:ubiquinone/menaquinone biosynthesis C-methylase UbiE
LVSNDFGGAILLTTNSHYDPIADSYDASRSWPPAVMAGFTTGLAYLLPSNGPVLEVGIGAGRIAAPLREKSVRVVGLDISSSSLQKFAGKIAQMRDKEPRLIQGDAIHLPFAESSFKGVYTVHVFHLIRNWQQALRELQRVLKPGGVYINGTSNEVATDITNHMEVGWEMILKRNNLEISSNNAGVRSRAVFHNALKESGAQVEVVPICRWSESYTPRHRLESMSARLAAMTPRVPDLVFSKSIVDYERWLKAQYGELDSRLELVREAVFYVWRWS